MGDRIINHPGYRNDQKGIHFCNKTTLTDNKNPIELGSNTSTSEVDYPISQEKSSATIYERDFVSSKADAFKLEGQSVSHLSAIDIDCQKDEVSGFMPRHIT
ncbi:hypothetical protein RF11_15651 [Thelohanellus kitauei]|uniref:Uncharacterized protein n=1 Tax=Thelohanellus kitauei TaxID=669202 RepID=A0A0C2N391_THEKT|nr:hypothetical protein RF11_15651 [Thelohanellus kitauei]